VQYLHHKQAGEESLLLKGDEHRYIFKVRRHREGEIIALRNLEDDILYSYEISSLDKKEALLLLKESRILVVKAKKKLHIGWCLIDPKSIEKLLPTLNEIGVSEISFIMCSRSQKNFRIDCERLERIILNSSQQCGRSKPMRLKPIDSLKEFLNQNPNAIALNFSNKILGENSNIETIVIGCEGGFAEDEIALFRDNIIGLDSPLILKSESAVCAVASKILL
jgi:16S rRNA (uracil1498-N3)-methyltransferase